MENNRWGVLMASAQEGDQNAYTTLLEELAVELRRYCHRKVAYLGIAEDCVQEILLRVHQVRHTYYPSKPFRPWVYALARNKLIDLVRKKTKTLQREINDSERISEMAGPEPNDNSKTKELFEAVNSLPAKYKSVIQLVKLDGASVKEAASQLGISESAVKVRASRAYTMLRKKVETNADL